MSRTTEPFQVHIGDFGRDFDDEVAAVLAAALHRRGCLHLIGTIANLVPALRRAQLAKGTYTCLGLDVPVAAGTDCNQALDVHDYEFDVPYLADPAALTDTATVIESGLDAAVREGRPLDLVLMSGMTDAAALCDAYPQHIGTTIRRVTLQSGVLTAGTGRAYRDAHGRLVPDLTANNTFDMAAAEHLYDMLQARGVQMIIVTRHAAYTAGLAPGTFRTLAGTGNPVGSRLFAGQRAAVAQLWHQANLDRADPQRTLSWGPEADPRDAAWFRRTLLADQDVNHRDEVWDMVTQLVQYDSLAVLASVPTLAATLFRPTSVDCPDSLGRPVTHEVIGLDATMTGVPDPDRLRKRLATLVLEGLQAPVHQQLPPTSDNQTTEDPR